MAQFPAAYLIHIPMKIWHVKMCHKSILTVHKVTAYLS